MGTDQFFEALPGFCITRCRTTRNQSVDVLFGEHSSFYQDRNVWKTVKDCGVDQHGSILKKIKSSWLFSSISFFTQLACVLFLKGRIWEETSIHCSKALFSFLSRWNWSKNNVGRKTWVKHRTTLGKMTSCNLICSSTRSDSSFQEKSRIWNFGEQINH